MFHVTKRDGKVADYDISKISAALKKAFDACGRQYNDNIDKEWKSKWNRVVKAGILEHTHRNNHHKVPRN